MLEGRYNDGQGELTGRSVPDATLSSHVVRWFPTYRICLASKVKRNVTRASNLASGGKDVVSERVLKTAR